MIIKTKGIVLSYIKYGETSIICKIFTETSSIQTFIINGVRKSKSKNIALYQPLNILDLVIYHKESSGIQRIKEAKLDVIYKSLHLDIKKISICYYISEFLSKILKSSEINEYQFNFIQDSLIVFDNIEYCMIDFNSIHQEIMKTLYNKGVHSLIIEGGRETLQSFIDIDLWDEARVFIGNQYLKNGVHAPKIKEKHISEEMVSSDLLRRYRR